MTLELLSLYGLPKVTAFPAWLACILSSGWNSVRSRASELSLPRPTHPALEELYLSRAVSMEADDPLRIRDASQIKAFYWFAEDVPDRVWVPAVQVIGKPAARSVTPSDWFAERN